MADPIEMEGEDIVVPEETTPWDDYFNQWYSDYRPVESMQPDATQSPVPDVVAPDQIEFTPEEVAPVDRSVSVSEKGYNFSPDQVAKVQKNFRTPLDRDIAASDAELLSEAQAQVQDYANITEQKKSLAERRGALDAKVADEQAKYLQEEADLQRELRFQEQAGIEKARLAEEQALAQYVAGVKAYEATNINPGQLWGNMDNGTKFMTMVSVFAHNVLATQGIETTAMDSLNRAIQDNISAQMANLNKKGQTAGMFKDIWMAVRSQSESDREARSKIHGMMLSEFKSAVVAKLAGFDSDYALLKAQESQMAFDEAFVNQVAEVRKDLRNNMEDGRKFALDKATNQAQLYLHSRALKLQEDAARGKQAIEEELTDPKYLVADPETREIIGAAGDEKVAQNVQKGLNKLSKAYPSIQRLAELMRALDGQVFQGWGKGLFTNEKKAELESIVNELEFLEAVDLTGLTATDAQMDRIRKIRGTIDGWTTGALSDNAVPTLVTTQIAKTLRDVKSVKAELRGNVYEVNEATKKKYRRIEGNIEGLGNIEDVLPAEKELKKDTSATKVVGDTAADGRVKNRAVPVDEDYVQQFYDAGFERPQGLKIDTPAGKAQFPATIPAWAKAQMDLSEIVKNKSEAPEARLEALQQLKLIQRNWLTAGTLRQKGLEDEGIMASYLLDELEKGGWTDYKSGGWE